MRETFQRDLPRFGRGLLALDEIRLLKASTSSFYHFAAQVSGGAELTA